jgi:hypothetical protein
VTAAIAIGEHGHLDVGFTIGPLWLRVALLCAVLSTAAFAMLRGFLGEPDRRTTIAVVTAAFSAAALELLLSGGLALPEQTVPLLLAALVLPLYLTLSQAQPYAAMIDRTRRYALWVFWPAALIAAARFAQAWLDDSAILMHTGVVFALVAVSWYAVARPRRRGVLVSRVGAWVLAVGLVGSVAQAMVSAPGASTPGLATTARVSLDDGQVNVVVVPNLPGWNLVHVDSGVSVGTDPAALKRSKGWMAVRLPAGRAELWVGNGRDTGSFVTNTGTTGAAPSGLSRPDGPECAEALLGRMLATGALSDATCPADVLTPTDAAELTVTVEQLALSGATTVAVVADESPRGQAAADTVRTTAAGLGLSVVDPDQHAAPLVVVSGWSAAAPLTVSARRAVMAPWLLDDVSSFQRYEKAHRAAYPTLSPSMAGFQGWLAGSAP